MQILERYQTEKMLLLFNNCFQSLLHTLKDCHASWLALVSYSACWVMRSLFCCKMHLYRWVIMISKQNNFPLSFESDPGLLWVCLTLICDWSRKNSRHHLNQSNTKLKPILIWSLTFSRASSRLPVFTLSSHWLNMPLTFALIVSCYYFGKCSLTHNWKRL